MALKLLTGVAVALAITAGTGACATLVGTSDLEACEGDCAGSGGSGGGSTGTESSTGDTSSGSNGSVSSSSSGSGDTSSSSGGSCFLVTLTYEGITGDGRVRITTSPESVDFDEGVSEHCLPPGDKVISIECRSEDDDVDDYPLLVEWGNTICGTDESATCSFLLDSPQEFALTGDCD